MKIISQSTVAHSPAYFHLGYLAATQTVPSRGTLGGGALALLLGCVLTLRFVRRDPTGKGRSQIALVLRSDNPRLRRWGLVCLVAGVAIITIGFKTAKTHYAMPERYTQAHLHVLASYINSHLAEGEPIPESMAALATQWEFSKAQVEDAWSNEIRLTRTTTEEGTEYTLVSAGKDEEFDTADDLVETIPYPPEESEVPT